MKVFFISLFLHQTLNFYQNYSENNLFSGQLFKQKTNKMSAKTKHNEMKHESQYDFSFTGILEKQIEKECLYMKPDLSIADLSRLVATNRTYLSIYFKEVLHSSFYEYINRMRIFNACIPLMKSNSKLKIEAIAFESGFRSVTTFRRAFTKYVGTTPNKYLRKIQQEEAEKE